MGGEYKISVVVPAYNVGGFIRRTIKSLVAQSIKGVEIIIVYTPSEDNTLDVIWSTIEECSDELNGKTIRVLKERQRGVSVARNRGLKVARGDFILFLDGDDFLHNLCLGKLFDMCVRLNADVVFCGFDTVVIEGGKKIILSKYSDSLYYLNRPAVGLKALELYLAGSIWPWLGSTLFSKEFLRKNNISFDNHLLYGEDKLFIIKSLFNANKVYNVKESLSYYVCRLDSASKKISLRRYDGIRAMLRAYRYLKLNKCPSEILKILENYKLPLTSYYILKLFETSDMYDEFVKHYDTYFLKSILKNYTPVYLNLNNLEIYIGIKLYLSKFKNLLKLYWSIYDNALPLISK